MHGEVQLDDVKRFKQPLFIGAAANDWAFPEPRVAQAEALIRARKSDHVHRIVRYPGTYHGFAVRGDERNPLIARAKDQVSCCVKGWPFGMLQWLMLLSCAVHARRDCVL